MLDDVELNLVVSPYELAGLSIAKYIRSINVPKDSQIISMRKIAGEKAEALQFNIGKNPAFVGKKISVLAKRLKSGVLMCAIIRKHLPIIPNGETVLEEDDYIIVASLEKKIEKLEDLLK
jgi:Trk K+ transport system NAD-binding subunit